MLNEDKILNSHATAKTAQGSIVESGKIIAICDSPMICIENEWTGHRLWWRLDLCEVFLDILQDTLKVYGPF